MICNRKTDTMATLRLTLQNLVRECDDVDSAKDQTIMFPSPGGEKVKLHASGMQPHDVFAVVRVAAVLDWQGNVTSCRSMAFSSCLCAIRYEHRRLNNLCGGSKVPCAAVMTTIWQKSDGRIATAAQCQTGQASLIQDNPCIYTASVQATSNTSSSSSFSSS